ncbi:MAG TPA: 6-phosphogluconolactonase [Candidatus Saccharimonadales bacterium]|nr:6-phosphogluconolactonase [Candidatus Saccharimonadales bacterium]
MQLIKTSSPESAVKQLVAKLDAALSHHTHVVWFLSGGSALPIAVQVMAQLTQDLSKLTIMQIDERFGPVGHKDSNWQQLQDAGFEARGARCQPVLTGLPLEETVARYQSLMHQALQDGAQLIGLFGIGADGHTAGLLPDSSALNETSQLVTSYQGPDFMRITLTIPAITQFGVAVAQVSGAAKLPTLRDLQTDLPPSQQPAQILKRIPKCYIYNDYLEGAV